MLNSGRILFFFHIQNFFRKEEEPEWKRIQIQTFTRWCNSRISVQKLTVEDLTTDFCDGVKLIILLEVLSQKRLGKFNKNPRVYAQRMENVEIALQFITQAEKIRLVNIGRFITYDACNSDYLLGFLTLIQPIEYEYYLTGMQGRMNELSNPSWHRAKLFNRAPA